MALQGAGVSPGLHFHLAATINALTDIPLVPAINSSANVVHKFSLHWLNNKEIYFSLEAEKILQELAKVAMKREDSGVIKELQQEAVKDTTAKPARQPAAAEASPLRHVTSREGLGGEGQLSHTPSVTSFNTDISQPASTAASMANLGSMVSHMAVCGIGLWVALHHSSTVSLYHTESFIHMQDINIASNVSRALGGSSKRSIYVTALSAAKGLLWVSGRKFSSTSDLIHQVGTNVGIALTIPLPRLEGVPIISGKANISYHAHFGPVRMFLPLQPKV